MQKVTLRISMTIKYPQFSPYAFFQSLNSLVARHKMLYSLKGNISHGPFASHPSLQRLSIPCLFVWVFNNCHRCTFCGYSSISFSMGALFQNFDGCALSLTELIHTKLGSGEDIPGMNMQYPCIFQLY